MNYSFKSLKGDIFGAVTAAVIALPVALAYGVASGVGAVAGLYAAIAIAFFAAVFGGTPSMVSGPTVAVTVAMAVIVTHSAANLAEAFTIVMFAGLIQIGIGAFRLGKLITYTPYSVISGFLTGIGVILISMQILPVLGAPAATDGIRGTIGNLPDALSDINLHAFAVAALTLAMLLVWPRKLHRFIPDTLGALCLGSLLGIFVFPQAPVVGPIPSEIPSLQVPVLNAGFLIRTLEPALVLAIIGSVYSLLVALVADAMTRSRHNPNRELVGQGIANIVSGIIGGLPGSGSTLPTFVSIRTGGRTRVSGILVALILFAFLFGLGELVERIPLAVLAALLLHIGWYVIDWRFLTRLAKIEKSHVTVMLITAVLTVFVDILTAVAIGLIVSGMINAMNAEPLELDNVVSVPLVDEFETENPFSARTGLVRMTGRFTVASAGTLSHVIGEDIREHEIVIFDFTPTEYMDDSTVMVIRELVRSSYEEGKPCIVMGLSDYMAKTLNSLAALQEVEKANFVDSLEQARQIANEFLRSKD